MQERLQIPGKSDDVRAKRARDQIAWALIKLILEKDYDTISVQDIAARAQVSRSTFYAHFHDKDDILVRYNVVFGQFLGEQLTWDESSCQYRFPIVHLFEHVQGFRGFYEALTRARKMEDLLKVLRINMAEGFEKCIVAAHDERSDPPAPLVAYHIASSITHLLVWWMERHCPIDARIMEAHFHRFVAGCGKVDRASQTM